MDDVLHNDYLGLTDARLISMVYRSLGWSVIPVDESVPAVSGQPGALGSQWVRVYALFSPDGRIAGLPRVSEDELWGSLSFYDNNMVFRLLEVLGGDSLNSSVFIMWNRDGVELSVFGDNDDALATVYASPDRFPRAVFEAWCVAKNLSINLYLGEEEI